MISGCSSIPAWWAITSNTLGTFCAMFAKKNLFSYNSCHSNFISWLLSLITASYCSLLWLPNSATRTP